MDEGYRKKYETYVLASFFFFLSEIWYFFPQKMKNKNYLATEG